MEVSLSSSNIKHYEGKGYYIPRRKDKKGRMAVASGTSIIINVIDLSVSSREKVTKICDVCGEENVVSYFHITRSRKKEEKDCCHACSLKTKAQNTRRREIKMEDSLYFNFPELMKEWDFDKNKEIFPKNILPFSNKKAWWVCLKCKSSYDMDISHRTCENNGCPFCSNQRVNETNCFANTHTHLLKEWDYERNKNIDPHKITYGSQIHVWWKCGKEDCKNQWRTLPHVRASGSNCPLCVDNYSKQKHIYGYLLSKKLNVVTEYRIKECRNKNPLPFDVAILSNNNLVIGLIEYDGEQHFKPMKHWGGEVALEGVKKRDKIKDTYCEKNNIPLLRIPYWEYGLAEDKIDSFLSDIKINSHLKEVI